MTENVRDLHWYVLHQAESSLDLAYKDMFSAYVKIVRKKRGWTRTYMAHTFGLNRDLLTALEDGLAGEDQMTDQERAVLLEALGISFDRFYALNPHIIAPILLDEVKI